jgi:hypothetical protein
MATPSGSRQRDTAVQVLTADSSAFVLIPGGSSTRIRAAGFPAVAASSLPSNLRLPEAAGITF